MKKYDLEDTLFQQAFPVMKVIEQNNFEAYFVGGSVRDLLLNRPISDIDIASSATPDEIQKIFHHTIEIGKEHGTVIVVFEGEHYEITTFRTEGEYSDFRRPDEVTFVRTLAEDTLRRDFTINALALDIHGNLYDYHGGQEDLEQRLIRAVGVPSERFQEDALRILRGLRFASQLNFKIDSETMEAMQANAFMVEHLAFERIQEEFNKLLTGSYFSLQFENIISSQVIPYLSLGSEQETEQALIKLANDLSPYNRSEILVDFHLAWALLLQYLKIDTKKSQNKLLRHWKFSNESRQLIRQFYDFLTQDIKNFDSPEVIYRYNVSILKELEVYYKVVKHKQLPLVANYQALPIHSKKDLKINGREIMTILNLERGGPIVGEILDQIEKLVLTSQLENELTTLHDFVLNYEQ